MEELDLRFEAGAMEGAQQVGGEHERALEDRHHQQVLRLGGGDLLRHRVGALSDRRRVEENLDLPFAAHELASVKEALSPGAPNFTSTSRTPSGGEASRARNGARSPAASRSFAPRVVQT